MNQFKRGYLRFGIEGAIPWPSIEQTVEYAGQKITLCPETESLAPSMLMKLDGSLTLEQARRILFELLSGLTWVRGGGALVIQGVAGTAPVGVGKRNFRHISDATIDYLPSPHAAQAKIALAIFREASTVNSVPYAFLGYFKIINMLHAHGKQQILWVNTVLPKLRDRRALERLAELRTKHPDVGEYLYASGRCAVAHANSSPILNPDDPNDVARLDGDLPVARALAEYAVEFELGVKSENTFWSEHLFELEGFRSLFGEALITKLKEGKRIDAASLPLPKALSLRVKGAEHVFSSFEEMKVTIELVENGVVQLRLTDAHGLLQLSMLLDFADERLVFDALKHVDVQDDGSVAAARVNGDFYRFLKKWMPNGVLEVWDSAAGQMLGRSQPTVLENFIPDWKALDRAIIGWTDEGVRRSIVVEQSRQVTHPE